MGELFYYHDDFELIVLTVIVALFYSGVISTGIIRFREKRLIRKYQDKGRDWVVSEMRRIFKVIPGLCFSIPLCVVWLRYMFGGETVEEINHCIVLACIFAGIGILVCILYAYLFPPFVFINDELVIYSYWGIVSPKRYKLRELVRVQRIVAEGGLDVIFFFRGKRFVRMLTMGAYRNFDDFVQYFLQVPVRYND